MSQVCLSPDSIPQIAYSQQATYHRFITCFPQMRPEVAFASQKSKVKSQKVDNELSEDEKVVIDILKAYSPMDLNDLKGQTGLSNKKWDKAIKGLTKNKLAKVEKTDAGLFVSLA